MPRQRPPYPPIPLPVHSQARSLPTPPLPPLPPNTLGDELHMILACPLCNPVISASPSSLPTPSPAPRSHHSNRSPSSSLWTLGATSPVRTVTNGSPNSRPSLPPLPSRYVIPSPHHRPPRAFARPAPCTLSLALLAFRAIRCVYSRHLFLRGGTGVTPPPWLTRPRGAFLGVFSSRRTDSPPSWRP
jgi:hypothetical protein